MKRKGSRKEEGGSIMKKEEVRRQTLSSALGVESPESGRVPWVRLEFVIGLRKRYAPPVRTLSMTKGPSHLGLSLSFFFSGKRRTSSPIL